MNILTYPSSDVAANLDESGDQQTLVTFALSEKADDAMIHSGTSILWSFSPEIENAIEKVLNRANMRSFHSGGGDDIY